MHPIESPIKEEKDVWGCPRKEVIWRVPAEKTRYQRPKGGGGEGWRRRKIGGGKDFGHRKGGPGRRVCEREKRVWLMSACGRVLREREGRKEGREEEGEEEQELSARRWGRVEMGGKGNNGGGTNRAGW